MKRRKLSTAKIYAKLSPQDEELREYLMWQGSHGHMAVGFPGSKKRIQLHRLIIERMGIEIPPDHTVDHINRIPLDNRRENLRVATYSQNNSNNECSGVSYYKKQDTWTASVQREYKDIFLGNFKTKEEALAARKRFLDNEGLVQ